MAAGRCGCGCFVLFCLLCNSQCACGGMTTAETTFPPSNLGWLWPTCSPFVERGALCTECRPCHMGRRARALLTPYIERDQLGLWLWVCCGCAPGSTRSAARLLCRPAAVGGGGSNTPLEPSVRLSRGYRTELGVVFVLGLMWVAAA